MASMTNDRERLYLKRAPSFDSLFSIPIYPMGNWLEEGREGKNDDQIPVFPLKVIRLPGFQSRDLGGKFGSFLKEMWCKGTLSHGLDSFVQGPNFQLNQNIYM